MLAAAPSARLSRLLESDAASSQLTLVRSAMLDALQTELSSGPVLATSQAAADYLFAQLAHAPAEQVRVLFLDAKCRLIRDEAMSLGTVTDAQLYPREIIRRCLELAASAIILAHNHPSGDSLPSKADVASTRRIVEAARSFGIEVHDHLIVSRSGCASMRALRLL